MAFRPRGTAGFSVVTLGSLKCLPLLARHLDGERIETATLYDLTDLGSSLDAPLAPMTERVEANWGRVEAARRDWDHRAGRT